eukprot:15479863-Alexandrium_andersonii.AAC.1
MVEQVREDGLRYQRPARALQRVLGLEDDSVASLRRLRACKGTRVPVGMEGAAPSVATSESARQASFQ